jgi:hypothetical protein
MSKKSNAKNTNVNIISVYFDDYDKTKKHKISPEKIIKSNDKLIVTQKKEVAKLGNRNIINIKTKDEKYILKPKEVQNMVKNLHKEYAKTHDDYKAFTKLSVENGRYYTFMIDDEGDMEGYADSGNPSII